MPRPAQAWPSTDPMALVPDPPHHSEPRNQEAPIMGLFDFCVPVAGEALLLAAGVSLPRATGQGSPYRGARIQSGDFRSLCCTRDLAGLTPSASCRFDRILSFSVSRVALLNSLVTSGHPFATFRIPFGIPLPTPASRPPARAAAQQASRPAGDSSSSLAQRPVRRRSLPLPPRPSPDPGQRSRSSALALMWPGIA